MSQQSMTRRSGKTQFDRDVEEAADSIQEARKAAFEEALRQVQLEQRATGSRRRKPWSLSFGSGKT